MTLKDFTSHVKRKMGVQALEVYNIMELQIGHDDYRSSSEERCDVLLEMDNVCDS